MKVESPLYVHVPSCVCVVSWSPLCKSVYTQVCVCVVCVCVTGRCSWLLSWIEADMTGAGLTDWQEAARMLLGILT